MINFIGGKKEAVEAWNNRKCQRCGKHIPEDDAIHMSGGGTITQCDPCFQEWVKTQ